MPRRKIKGGNARREVEEEEDDFDPAVLFAEAAAAQFSHKLKELEAMKNRSIKMIKNYVQFAEAQLPPYVLNMTLGELRAMEEQQRSSMNESGGSCASPSSEGIRRRSSEYGRRSLTPPPTFRKPQIPPMVLKRSPSHESLCRNKVTYQTPGGCKVPVNPITPKVNPDSPLGMLRVPEPGEFAMSATGSPLLVTSTCAGSCNVNIPLKDGKVLSLLPKPGVNTDSISENLHPNVMKQLETLTDTLNAILKSCEDA